MLLSLAQWLQSMHPEWGFLRVFQYLTFRAVMAAMTALLIGSDRRPFRDPPPHRPEDRPAGARLRHGDAPEQKWHPHHGRCADPVASPCRPCCGSTVQPLRLDRADGHAGFWRHRLGGRLAQGGQQGPRRHALAREVLLAVGDRSVGCAVPGVQHFRELQHAGAGAVLPLGAVGLRPEPATQGRADACPSSRKSATRWVCWASSC
jgi:hypothetical protein